jgi:hypothetical protein
MARQPSKEGGNLMARIAKLVGVVLLLSGLALALYFAVTTFRDEGYQKAVMLMERNKGNSMYELQYFVAEVRRAIAIGVAVCGGLVALNGATFLLLGAVAARQEGTARG